MWKPRVVRRGGHAIAARRLAPLALLFVVAVSACGGRATSRAGSQAESGAQAGRGGGATNDTKPPDCCNPPVTCFAAGTPIDTPTGPRPIEQIEVGQLVLAYDEALSTVVVRPVTGRMQHAGIVVGQLVLGDGRTIVTTPDHPFYVASEGTYRAAEALGPEAQLLSLSDAGRLSSTPSTGYFTGAAPVRMPVFNISVSGVHNYFADGVLVHNKSPISRCEALSRDTTAQDLVALTGWERSRSVHALTGVAIEPEIHDANDGYYGQTLAFSPAIHGAELISLAAAARTASSGALAAVECGIDASQPDACARDFIENFVTRAYRRPLVDAERARYLQLFRGAQMGSDFATALQTVVEAALQSPHFLYKVELSRGDLSDHELATRLSYFMQGLPPDAELSALASAGGLRQGLDSVLQRLGASAPFVESMRALYTSWLGLDRLADADAVSAELSQAMRSETETFFDWHIAKDAPVASLLTEPLTFLDTRMAIHYGLPAPVAAWQPFQLDVERHAGALTQASFMTAFPTITQRGKWLSRRLLCNGPPPPPANVVFPPPPGPGEDRRAWLEQATSDARCQACHQMMDPIGFALESFDELGRWRMANDTTVVELRGSPQPIQGAAELASALVSTREVLNCTLGHWTVWATKRLPDEYLACRLEEATSTDLTRATTRQLAQAIAKSEAFLTGVSDASSVEDPPVSSDPVAPLATEADRSQAIRTLIRQELAALRERLPRDVGLQVHEDALLALE